MSINFDEFHPNFFEYLNGGSVKNIHNYFTDETLATVKHTKNYQNMK
jgi:hypothetical protein